MEAGGRQGVHRSSERVGAGLDELRRRGGLDGSYEVVHKTPLEVVF